MSGRNTILSQLTAVIEDRKAKRPPNSYTTKLFDGGVDEIAAKVCEEAGEFVATLVKDGDTVLIKGSRGVRLEKALERICAVKAKAGAAGR